MKSTSMAIGRDTRPHREIGLPFEAADGAEVAVGVVEGGASATESPAVVQAPAANFLVPDDMRNDGDANLFVGD